MHSLVLVSCHTRSYLTLFTFRRRVSTSTASQQQVHHLHWSHRVTADNPHGFTDKVLARLHVIEDPAEREKAEKKVLADRRSSEMKRSNAEVMARIRDDQYERNRQRKINAGYVILVILLIEYKYLSYFILQQLSCAHTAVSPLEPAFI
jgi:hypothetical protein